MAIVKKIGPKELPAPLLVPYVPTPPDATYTFWGEPNDTAFIGNIVYFMYSAGRIKIGFSGGLRGRHMGLKMSGPFPPVVILVMAGSERDERKLHARFADDRLHGEWFTVSKKMRGFLGARLCDVGRSSFERAEAEFRDYCSNFIESYKPISNRRPRPACPHGKPTYQHCAPCERERDLKIMDDLKARELPT